MNSLVLTAPILPGKLAFWRRMVDALNGERIETYRETIRQTGLSRLRVWHQHAPDGSDLAVVLYEGATPERFLHHIATSDAEFAVWFRQGLTEAHGLDLSQPPPPAPVLVIDQKATSPVYSSSRVRVQDPIAWRRVMDELRPLRLSHGALSEQILRAKDDDHEYTVLIGWTSEDHARRYYAHAELRAAIERAGGVDGRGLTFLI